MFFSSRRIIICSTLTKVLKGKRTSFLLCLGPWALFLRLIWKCRWSSSWRCCSFTVVITILNNVQFFYLRVCSIKGKAQWNGTLVGSHQQTCKPLHILIAAYLAQGIMEQDPTQQGVRLTSNRNLCQLLCTFLEVCLFQWMYCLSLRCCFQRALYCFS